MSITIRMAQDNSSIFGVPSLNDCNSQDMNKRKTIFAGNLMPSDMSELVEQKRSQARKQAMKLINDAWGRDNKASDNIKSMDDEKSDQVKKLGELNGILKSINDNKKAIMEEYGIDPDSQEQKDLELLEKYQNNINGSSYDSFSEEEINRLKELQDLPRTEYQNKILQQNSVAGAVNIEISKIKNQLVAMTESINDAKIEQLKSQDMLDADAAADEIVDAANDEIFGLLIKEGMDHIDETQEEQQEKAEEAAEKKEEEEKQLEEAKQDREEQEAQIEEVKLSLTVKQNIKEKAEQIENIKESCEEIKHVVKGELEMDKMETDISMRKLSNDSVKEAQKNIQKILKENNLINEDLKGIKIDFNF